MCLARILEHVHQVIRHAQSRSNALTMRPKVQSNPGGAGAHVRGGQPVPSVSGTRNETPDTNRKVIPSSPIVSCDRRHLTLEDKCLLHTSIAMVRLPASACLCPTGMRMHATQFMIELVSLRSWLRASKRRGEQHETESRVAHGSKGPSHARGELAASVGMANR